MIRVGHGMDVHKLTEGRKLILCGVEIPYEKGLLGHSDADVALHALMDAMLGAVALGDIGAHFPDTDAGVCRRGQYGAVRACCRNGGGHRLCARQRGYYDCGAGAEAGAVH